jgi:hypothetical protein
VSRYSEQSSYGPEPTTRTLPKGALVSVETVAGPVGALVTGSAQELLSAFAGELNCRAPAARASENAAKAAATGHLNGSVGKRISPPQR